MLSRWRDLPSLSALRAFDATARHGNFAEAGRALNVTHAAVTQQVRALEAELGVSLVRRTGRTVSLTSDGADLAEALDRGFATIAGGVSNLRRAGKGRVVRVATTTFIAEARIMPHMPDFWACHPGIEVAMVPSPSLADFTRDGFDMAVRGLTEGWTERPGEELRPLLRCPVFAVAAPILAASHRSPQDMPWVLGPKSAWELGLLAASGIDVDRLNHVIIGSPHLEMSACRQGLGATVATEAVCREDVAAGRLVILPVTGLPSITYVVALPSGARRPAVDIFADWLSTIF